MNTLDTTPDEIKPIHSKFPTFWLNQLLSELLRIIFLAFFSVYIYELSLCYIAFSSYLVSILSHNLSCDTILNFLATSLLFHQQSNQLPFLFPGPVDIFQFLFCLLVCHLMLLLRHTLPLVSKFPSSPTNSSMSFGVLLPLLIL